ncbi:MAG: apolipoprotein N-acyltransferase [Abitibacteriaceae bacterium]|nr:apolipoprotein N-acyltransferase [Abditibacteriaceae bacterium]
MRNPLPLMTPALPTLQQQAQRLRLLIPRMPIPRIVQQLIVQAPETQETKDQASQDQALTDQAPTAEAMTTPALNGTAFPSKLTEGKPTRSPLLPATPGGDSTDKAATIRVRLGCALLTALLWWLPGQQAGWFALGWIALTPLFWALHDLDGRARWRLGHLTGWLSYALINWWIIPTITKASPVIGIPAPLGALLGVLAVTFIALVHSSIVAGCAWLWNPRASWVQRAPWALPVLIALLWACLDALRYETQLAHGWGALAYTQWRDTALLQSAAYIGQHGLSALCVWFATSLALWIRRGDVFLWRAPVAVFILLHGWGAYRLTLPFSPRPPLRVLLVQTNIPSWRKNAESSAESPYAQAMRLTHEGVQAAAARTGGSLTGGNLIGAFDLIVWPETTAIVWQPKGRNRFLREGALGTEMAGLDALARELKTPILFGAHRAVSREELYNTAVLITPNGEESFSAKQHLVPFGERAPYNEYLPFLRALAPSPEITPGVQTQTLAFNRPSTGERLVAGCVICFESCFRYPARRLAKDGAQLIVVMTNDEWFSGTNSPWEHAAMATVRAVENRAAVVQVANAGYSFVVDPYGRFVVNSDNTLSGPQAVPDRKSGPPTQALSTFGVAQALPATVSLP